MTVTSVIPRPWSERQRQALRTLVQEAAVRAKEEVAVQAGFTQRSTAIEQERVDAERRVAEEFERERVELEQSLETTRATLQAEYQHQVEQTSAEYYQLKEAARAEARDAKERIEQEFKEARWTTQTLFEADKKVAKDHMVQQLRQ
jgi:hypothetical protein